MHFEPSLSSQAQPEWRCTLHPQQDRLFLVARAYMRFASSRNGAPHVCATPWHTGMGEAYMRLRGNLALPNGQMAREMPFTVTAGTRRMDLLLLGPRQATCKRWRRAHLDLPVHSDLFPLEPSQAFGGCSAGMAYPRNPLGKGFALSRSPESMAGVELPRLENPIQRLDNVNWPLRRWDAWPTLPMPWYPDGSCSAHHPLAHALPWEPGTSIALTHSLSSPLRWKLPDWTPVGALVEDGNGRTAPLKLRGVDLHLDSGIATLDYVTSFSIPGPEYLAELRELKAGVVP